MDFPKPVLRWTQIVSDEIVKGHYPFPVEYPLAVIQVESGGYAGVVNPNSGASGLMQVMPGTLNEYNRHNKPKISLEALQSPYVGNGVKQIRVGLWVMGKYLQSGFRWLNETNPNPGLSDLIKISDLMFVAGPGKIRRKFRMLDDRSFNSLVAHDPEWQPFAHPRKVWTYATVNNDPSWDVPAIDAWVTGEVQVTPPDPPQVAQAGILLSLLFLAFASAWISKQ